MLGYCVLGLFGSWVAGLLGCWVVVFWGCWVVGFLVCCVVGLLGCWVGLLGFWVLGFLGGWVVFWLLACWVAGFLDCCVVVALLGSWVVGLLGCWVIGLLGFWVVKFLGGWVVFSYPTQRRQKKQKGQQRQKRQPCHPQPNRYGPAECAKRSAAPSAACWTGGQGRVQARSLQICKLLNSFPLLEFLPGRSHIPPGRPPTCPLSPRRILKNVGKVLYCLRICEKNWGR